MAAHESLSRTRFPGLLVGPGPDCGGGPGFVRGQCGGHCPGLSQSFPGPAQAGHGLRGDRRRGATGAAHHLCRPGNAPALAEDGGGLPAAVDRHQAPAAGRRGRGGHHRGGQPVGRGAHHHCGGLCHEPG